MLADASRTRVTCGTQALPTRGTSQKAGRRTRSRPNVETAARACQAASPDAPALYDLTPLDSGSVAEPTEALGPFPQPTPHNEATCRPIREKWAGQTPLAR